jgi:hypothetical protein
LGVLSWIVFGLIAGIIAKLLMPGRDPGGCIITMLLGVARDRNRGVVLRVRLHKLRDSGLGSRGSPGCLPPHPKELSPRAERGEQDRLALPALLEWEI